MNVLKVYGVNRFDGRLTPCTTPASVTLPEFVPYPDQSCHSLFVNVSSSWASQTSCTNCTPAVTAVSPVCQVASIFAWLTLSVLICSWIGSTCEPMMNGFVPETFGD